jgi:hypothetical protein
MKEFLAEDMDFIEGSDESGDLIWNGDGWSLVDNPVVSAVYQHEVVSGLDSEGCSLPQNDVDLRASSKVIVFAQRARVGRLIAAVAA